MPTWLTDSEHHTLRTLMDLVVQGDDTSPGAGAAGGADYVDRLLGAFDFDPPHIWARRPGSAGPVEWLELGAAEELAWRTRIEGSNGHPEREFNGPVRGFQEQYRNGLAALGTDFVEADPEQRSSRLSAADPEWRELLFEHACEALYGDPAYGGNQHRVGWDAIGFDGDVQPLGWTDAEVTHPDGTP